MENQSNNPEIFDYNQQQALPNATAVLVLGIIGIVGCFCYGVVGLVCSIIAIVLARKDMALYNASPMRYTPGSFSNLKAGRVCAIVGLSMSILYLVAIVIVMATIGFAALSHPETWMNR